MAGIEERFAGEPVVVVGIHSAKFFSEKDPENIRHAVARLRVAHPVVVDSEHEIWGEFGVHAWPTLILIDAAGYIRETISGEIEVDDLEEKIRALLAEGASRGILADEPLDVARDSDADSTLLRFPAKLHVAAERLFVADTAHNRIVVANLDGVIQGFVGEGGVGAHDGPAAHASFHDPHGMAVAGERLFVADTGNHLLRAVDLQSREVSTVAGTGTKGKGLAPRGARDALSVSLRSPWALLAVGRQLLVAMAGSHQIWLYDSERGAISPWAGSGNEDHVDGKLSEAAFAQPSGLARAGRFVMIADSEVSSVRALDLEEGLVKTIVGRGLFDFGDRDGAPGDVLLQHPMDVAVGDNVLYVADSYNNKVKAIAFGSMETRTVLGDGDPATMHEPSGIAFAGGKLLVADTNNHRVLRGDPQTGLLETLIG